MLLFFFGAIFSGLKSAFQGAKESAKKDREENLNRFLSELSSSAQKVRQGEYHANGQFNGAYPSAKANLDAFKRGEYNSRFFS